jgi:superfamily I DNA/RNA helicase
VIAGADGFFALHRALQHGGAWTPCEAEHLANGPEFRAVAVMACDDEVIPLQARIETVVDDADLEEVYNTERHLLYVAYTRARGHLLVTSVDPPSEFLDDLRM